MSADPDAPLTVADLVTGRALEQLQSNATELLPLRAVLIVETLDDGKRVLRYVLAAELGTLPHHEAAGMVGSVLRRLERLDLEGWRDGADDHLGDDD